MIRPGFLHWLDTDEIAAGKGLLNTGERPVFTAGHSERSGTGLPLPQGECSVLLATGSPDGEEQDATRHQQQRSRFWNRCG
jgi:hypothetical protein